MRSLDEAYSYELVKLCLSCKRKNCDGGCQGYHRKKRELQGKNYSMRRTYSAMGEEHTVEEWAEIFGTSHDALRAHIRRGKSLEQAMEAIERRKASMQRNGGQSLEALARAHGISANTVRSRIRIGWSLENALNTPVDLRFSGNKGR